MKKSFPAVHLLLISLCIWLSASDQEIKTVDGVRIVHNEKGGKWGKNLPIKIELIRTIGDINTLDENLAFNLPSDIVQDDAGNIYILDTGNCRIQKFSPEGKYMDTFGREGQGPGEFNSPTSLDIDSDGNIIVADWRSKKIQIFSTEGSLRKTITLTKHPLSETYALHSSLLAMKGTLGYDIVGKDNEPLPKLIHFLDTEGSIKMEFGEMFDYKHRLLNQKGNLFHFVTDQNDFIYLSFDHQNRIEKYSPEGKLLWKADRVINYSTKPLDKGKIERTATSQSFYSPRMNICSVGIAVDNKGRVWVVTLKRQIKEEEIVYTVTTGTRTGATTQVVGDTDLQETDMYTLEIFDPEGVLLGAIPHNHFIDGIYIKNDSLFLLDKMRGVKYYQYQIVENEITSKIFYDQ
jgi:DNA-binding beta-propeller fold protein YncE